MDFGRILSDVPATHDLTVDRRRFPAVSTEAFVIVRGGGEF